MPFQIVRNDITNMQVDAIVNAANETLLGGGGVDGAIHAAAGPELLAECRTLGGCRTGEAKITKGYRLNARYVIHTVGPVWRGGYEGEKELLASCYRSSLALALAYGCESVAFPLISAGVYGYPKDMAMDVASAEIRRFLEENEMTVYLVIFGRMEVLIGRQLFRDVKEYIDDVYAAERDDFSVTEQRRRVQLYSPILNAPQRREEAPKPFDQSDGAAFTDDSAAASADGMYAVPPDIDALPDDELDRLLEDTDEGFSGTLLRMIDERGMTDAQCYRRANIDRKLFSKIRSNPAYRPGKPTVFAFAVALRLSLEETRLLLERAGYSLTHSSRFDIILEYCIKKRIYDVFEINEVLFHYDMPLLGSGMA